MSEFSTEWINKWRFLNDPIMDTHCVSSKLFERALLKIETQNERIAELEAERRWIQVSERKPESGVPVLIFNGGIFTSFWDEQKDDFPFGGNWVWYPVRNKMYCYVGGVTHWQPIPQPPKEGE